MEDPFWTHDTFLFEGAFRYYRNRKQPVRGKLYVSEETYNFTMLVTAWNEHSSRLRKAAAYTLMHPYIMMHPYVIEPNLIMSVALSPRPKQYADVGEAIGKTLGTRVEGFRDAPIGNAQAWYYPEDRVGRGVRTRRLAVPLPEVLAGKMW